MNQTNSLQQSGLELKFVILFTIWGWFQSVWRCVFETFLIGIGFLELAWESFGQKDLDMCETVDTVI